MPNTPAAVPSTPATVPKTTTTVPNTCKSVSPLVFGCLVLVGQSSSRLVGKLASQLVYQLGFSEVVVFELLAAGSFGDVLLFGVGLLSFFLSVGCWLVLCLWCHQVVTFGREVKPVWLVVGSAGLWFLLSDEDDGSFRWDGTMTRWHDLMQWHNGAIQCNGITMVGWHDMAQWHDMA